MKQKMKSLILACLAVMIFVNVWAEGNEPGARYTLSGYVKDSQNGEALIGATIYMVDSKIGIVTNAYGFYSISLKPGNYQVQYSYLGYETISKPISLTQNVSLNIELSVLQRTIDEVVVTADRPELNVKKNEMSVNKLDMKTIRQIPALMGEVDLIKAIQLLPGVQSTSEGTSSFSVRGGGFDQNLILLDESTVYNASHLMGFFSVFNNDAIKDVKLYKGDIPPAYGGRLASLLDVHMMDGNTKKFSGTGGIGLISSRLTLEGPIGNENTSFIISGRRTYADLFLPLFASDDAKDSKLYFYDFNAKVNHKFSDKDRLYASGYFGKDMFKASSASMGFGNGTFTLRWNHLYTPKLFSNISLIYSKYNYALEMSESGTKFSWKYNMKDVGIKADYTYYPHPDYELHFGVQSVFHTLDPGDFETTGDNELQLIIPSSYSLEHAAYVSADQNITSRFSLKYGVRLSWFQNMGKGTVYNLDEDYNVIDSTVYKKGDIYKQFLGLEPRVGFKYEINDLTSIKGSYSRTRQYMQMASNSTAGTPMDLWFTAGPNVKPQVADIGAIGIFRNFFNQKIEASVEAYYKEMQHVIDFKDHASIYANSELEAELRFGKGKAYGLECMVEFPTTRLNGWVSYTYSHTERTIKEVNKGRMYLAPYDKPHSINVVLNYMVDKRIALGATWVYATGAPLTMPTGRAEVGNVIYPIYTGRNNYRMPAYHRLDISATIKTHEKPGRRWQGEWNFSIYNAYMRKNAWIIQFVQDNDNANVTKAQKVYLFSWVPSVTYNFKF